ncbi:hypothetical protein DJ71_24285, partial [Halorubrum sp. E3]
DRTAPDESPDRGSGAATDDGAVRIDVTDPDTKDRSDHEARDDGSRGDAAESPEVDVESELESIKRDVDGAEEEHDESAESGDDTDDSGKPDRE